MNWGLKALYKKLAPQFMGGDPWNYNNGEKAGTPNCSQYSNKKVKQYGVDTVGDAWSRYPNKGSKAKNLINGEAYVKGSRPKTYSRDEVFNWLGQAADSTAAHIKDVELRDGDIVSMYYKGSGAQRKAFETGKTGANSHTGHIIIKNNEPYVEHNIHGEVKLNKLEDVLGSGRNYGVTQIRRVYK